MAEAKQKQHGLAPAVAPDRKPPQDRQTQGRETLTANQPATSVAESFRRALDDIHRSRAALERALADGNTTATALAAADLKCALAAAKAAADAATVPDAAKLRDQVRELEASSAAVLERTPATPQPRSDSDRVVAALGNTHTAPAVKRPPMTDHPAFSPMTTANMTADVGVIVERLQGQWLSEADQQTIVERVERYAHIDAALHDVYPDATHYTDRFLGMLRARPYHRSSVGTLLQTQHAIVFDDMWHRLAGSPGARFRHIVWSSGDPTGAGARPETAMDAVIAPVFWRATSLLSFGIVDQSLFDEMAAAKGNAQRLGLAFTRAGTAAFDMLTFGTVRPAYHAAVAYAEQHPDCSLAEIRAAGLLAAADAILPRPELLVIAKRLGMVSVDAGELPPDTAQAVQAFFQGALKLITIGAIVHAKIQSGKAASREQILEELNASSRQSTPRPTTTPRPPTPPRPPVPAPAMPPARAAILRRVRHVAGEPELVFWEQVPLGATFEGVTAGPITAETLGVPRGSVIGYVVKSGKVTGSAIGDLGNVETTAPPYPDPFAGKPSAGPLGSPGGSSPTSRPTPPRPNPPAQQPRASAPTPQPRPTAPTRPARAPAGQPRPTPPGVRNPALISQLKRRSVPTDKRGRPNPHFDPNTPGHIAAHFKREQARTNSDSPKQWRNPPGFEAQHPNGRPVAVHGEPPGTTLHWGTIRDHKMQSAREEGKTPRPHVVPIPGPGPGE